MNTLEIIHLFSCTIILAFLVIFICLGKSNLSRLDFEGKFLARFGFFLCGITIVLGIVGIPWREILGPNNLIESPSFVAILLERLWVALLPVGCLGYLVLWFQRQTISPYNPRLLIAFLVPITVMFGGFGLHALLFYRYGSAEVFAATYALGILGLVGFLIMWGLVSIHLVRKSETRNNLPLVPGFLMIAAGGFTILWYTFAWDPLNSPSDLYFHATAPTLVFTILVLGGLVSGFGFFATNVKFLYEIPFDLYFILFLTERGEILHFAQFQNPESGTNPHVEQAIFAGALPTFTSIIREGTGLRHGDLRRVSLDKYEIVVQSRGAFLCALVSARESYYLRKTLLKITRAAQDLVVRHLQETRAPFSEEDGAILKEIIIKYIPSAKFQSAGNL